MDKLAGFSRLYIYTLKLKLYTRENDAHSGVIAATHTHTHTLVSWIHTQYVIYRTVNSLHMGVSSGKVPIITFTKQDPILFTHCFLSYQLVLSFLTLYGSIVE